MLAVHIEWLRVLLEVIKSHRRKQFCLYYFLVYLMTVPETILKDVNRSLIYHTILHFCGGTEEIHEYRQESYQIYKITL
jgi:hypothetical protein